MNDDDLLNDRRFPERPQHPDFWRLSEVILKQDGRHPAGGDQLHLDPTLIDSTSLFYMAQQRAAIMAQALHLSGQAQSAVYAALMTGIIHGIEFEKAGGHRD